VSIPLVAALKPKTQGAVSAWSAVCFSFGFELKRCGQSRLFPQVELIDHLSISIALRATQVIEQTTPVRDHLQEAASRRMILRVDL